MPSSIPRNRNVLIVFFLSFIITIGLIIATWDMQFWPSDEKVYWFDQVVRLPHLKYLSDIHKGMDIVNTHLLHGKEIMILCLSLMQRLMNDFSTIRPFVMVFALANFLASILIFLIGRRFWGERPALVAYLAYVGSLWPYLYILFAKHQPLGLAFFLIAFYVLQKAKPVSAWYALYCLAGVLLGLSFFSSTVSSLYFPFFVAGFFYCAWQDYRKNPAETLFKRIKPWALSAGLVLVGVAVVVLYVNWPDVGKNIQSYRNYVAISGSHNHFYYAQPFLQQWFGTEPVGATRGGAQWVIRYLAFIMPVLFPVYCAAIVYLLSLAVRRPKEEFLKVIGVILLSIAPPVMAEIVRVANYGSNYFPSIVGIIFLLGYTVYRLEKEFFIPKIELSLRRLGMVATIIVASLHVLTSGYVFFTDAYPTRMAMTYFSRALAKLNLKELHTYQLNPTRFHFVSTIAPDVARSLTLKDIQHLGQVKQGYVMLPPVTGDSIYVPATSHYVDFDNDGFLNELRRRGTLKDYAVASFRTLANSRIWLHEEEILSYRSLILHHRINGDEEGGRVWLLDAAKVARDFKKNLPSDDSIFLEQNRVRNVGTKNRMYVFQGFLARTKVKTSTVRLVARAYKMGEPLDGLQAFIYKLDEPQAVWVPADKRFFSTPVVGATLTSKREGAATVFDFQLTEPIKPGFYFFVIYRTGPTDDQNYYRLYTPSLTLL